MHMLHWDFEVNSDLFDPFILFKFFKKTQKKGTEDTKRITT